MDEPGGMDLAFRDAGHTPGEHLMKMTPLLDSTAALATALFLLKLAEHLYH
jgi:hypothetical protein